MLTVESLTSELGLKVLAGGDGAPEREIRWVHITELLDPTPWLSGGELLLTTGIPLENAEKQRAFIRRLADAGVAGLGFGTGFDHAKVPKALLTEAKAAGFPVFEVPYETPFIAITEAAFSRLVNEQYDVLSRGIAVNERLERLVLQGGGLDEVAREIAAGDRRQLGRARRPRRGAGQRGPPPPRVSARRRPRRGAAARERRRALRAESAGPARPGPRASGLAEAGVGGGLAGRGAALGGARGLRAPLRAAGGDRRGARADAGARREGDRAPPLRRGAGGDPLGAPGARTTFATGSRPSGSASGPWCSPSSSTTPRRPSRPSPSIWRARAGRRLVAPHPAGRRELLCAVVDGAKGDPLELASEAREALEGSHGPTRAATSRSLPTERVRHSFHEARCALEATGFANGAAPEVASHRDLGAFTLLLSVQDGEALRLYCESVLGPIEDSDERYAGELLRSLEAYIDRNGHWERAASDCYCHRHTLRYRIKRIEELTGRDLSRANDRVELWLALRAKELIA